MPRFGKRSLRNLATCHPDLQRVANMVVQIFDCSCIEGKRGKRKQNHYFAIGLSRKKYPDGRHNTEPFSDAMHLTPYPLDWDDIDRFRFLGGVVTTVAFFLKVPIRWGGDWDGDGDFKDQNLIDLAHYERPRG